MWDENLDVSTLEIAVVTVAPTQTIDINCPTQKQIIEAKMATLSKEEIEYIKNN